jgi:hypothetical protein
MGDLSHREDAWQREATAAAVAAARKIAISLSPNVPIGRLSDYEWGPIVTAVIFAWIEVRVRQAIADGRNHEAMVRQTGLMPSPCDAAVVGSILSELANRAEIDWSKPLQDWSADVMTSFLLLAWSLISDAELVRDHGDGRVLKKAEFDEKTGDPIPF